MKRLKEQEENQGKIVKWNEEEELKILVYQKWKKTEEEKRQKALEKQIFDEQKLDLSKQDTEESNPNFQNLHP